MDKHPGFSLIAILAPAGGSFHGRVGDKFMGTREFRNQEQVESPGYDRKPVRADIRATTGHGNVSVASVPAAPLQPR